MRKLAQYTKVLKIVFNSVVNGIKKIDLYKSIFLWDNSKGQVNSFPNWFGCFGYLMEPVMLRLASH